MDDRARLLLENLARQAVQTDLDQVMAEVQRLRGEVAGLRRQAGTGSPPPMSPRERRAEVQALRARGLSYPKIAAYLGVGKSTVARDAHDLGVPRESRGPYRRQTA